MSGMGQWVEQRSVQQECKVTAAIHTGPAQTRLALLQGCWQSSQHSKKKQRTHTQKQKRGKSSVGATCGWNQGCKGLYGHLLQYSSA